MNHKKRPPGHRLASLYRRWPWIAAGVLLIHLLILTGLDRVSLGLVAPPSPEFPGPLAVQMLPPPAMPKVLQAPSVPKPVPPAIVSEAALAVAKAEPLPAELPGGGDPAPTQSVDLASRIPTDSELPQVGGVALTAFWGEHTSGTQIGRGSIQLNFTPDGRYNIKLVTEAVGWATIFASKPLYAETIGTIGPGGLRPERYTHRSPRGKEEVSVFDYENKKITSQRFSEHPRSVVSMCEKYGQIHVNCVL